MHTAQIAIVAQPQNPAAATITVEGVLDINQAEHIRNMFLECLQSYESIQVVIRNTDKIDVSFVQILWAFQLSARNKGIQTEYQFTLDPELEALLQTSGIHLPALFN